MRTEELTHPLTQYYLYSTYIMPVCCYLLMAPIAIRLAHVTVVTIRSSCRLKRWLVVVLRDRALKSTKMIPW